MFCFIIYDSSNVFKVQLSNSQGDFSNTKTIGTYASKKSGIINCAIPLTTAGGNSYQLKVISTSPAITGIVSKTLIKINTAPPQPTITSVPINTIDLCPGTDVKLTSSAITNNFWNTVATTKSITVDSAAFYYVTVTNANACSTASDSVQVSYTTCGKPASPSTKGITATSAKFTWKHASCALKYRLQYRLADGGAFTSVTVSDTFYTVNGLTPATKYQWKVQTICSVNPPVSGDYTQLVNFITDAAAFIVADASTNLTSGFNASIVPNPSDAEASILIQKKSNEKISAYLADITGKILWKSENNSNSRISLPAHTLSAGTYIVTIVKGNQKKTLKFVKE